MAVWAKRRRRNRAGMMMAAAIGAMGALSASPARAQAPAPPPSPAANAAVTPDAPSREALDEAGPSVGALIGFGTDDVNKVGFGVRGGYTLPQPVGPGRFYVGGTFVYHLGTSQDLPDGSVTEKLWMLGAEGGYSFGAGPLVLRPFVGLGLADVSASVSVNAPGLSGASDGASSGHVFFSPGITALVPVTAEFGLGADLRAVVVSGSDAGSSASSLNFYLTGEYHFSI
jgi:hypothetical protein